MKSRDIYSSINNQYKSDVFHKLNFSFKKGKKILDVGCGDGKDAEIFIKLVGLKTYAVDIYKDPNIGNIKGLIFKKASITNLPFADSCFDYVFLHDVLHHIDEKKQSYKKHIKALGELKRVTKEGGRIIIVEANRYNPLFYLHMVKVKHHEHFTQKYFKRIVSEVFYKPQFRYFEAHLYPTGLLKIFKGYEYLMEKFSPKEILAYNVALVKNSKIL